MPENETNTQELNELKPLKIATLVGISDDTSNTSTEYKFRVPKYQRGYRWEKEHIETLLEDIKNFCLKKNKANDEYYCLQPVVVKKDKDGIFEIIDGQQRLTTIYLILRELKPKNLYNLTYDSNPSKEEKDNENSRTSIEDKLNNSSENDDMDTCYIKTAADTIHNWFSANENIKEEFINTFLNNTRIIWYEINEDDDEPISVFKRLNKGKIPLEDAELIKALFLKTSALEINKNVSDNATQQPTNNALEANKNSDNPLKQPTNDDETYKEKYIKKHQFVLASQWDNIEKELQDNSFWCFLSNDTEKENNRIEIILDIISQKHTIDEQLEEQKKAQNQNNNSDDDDDDDERIAEKTFIEKHDEHYTFRFFETRISNKTIEEKEKIWETIMDYFYMFQGWYNDRELYHLIGYIIETKIKQLHEICSLITEHKEENGIITLGLKKTRTEFVSQLKNWINESVIVETNEAIDNEKYNYTKNKNLIWKILLLHNIVSVLNNKDSAIYRFPFHTFKNEKKRGGWDVEHISPTTSGEGKAPDDKEGMIKWYLRNIKSKCVKEAFENDDENILEDFNKWWDDICEKNNVQINDDLIEKWKNREDNKDAIDDLENIINGLKDKLNDEDKDKFRTNYNKVITYFNSSMNEDKEEDDNPNRLQNKITNLVLLDAGTNRGYGNDLFPLKRDTIIEYDKNTKFIPPCTKNAFLAFYGGGYHSKWEKSNAEVYKKNIEKTIKKYFPDLKEDNQDV